MKLLVTKQFDRAVKDIKKKHDKQLQASLVDKVTKIVNRTLTEADGAHALSGKNTNGLNDVHISGDLIILYRYDVETDTLIISAKLHDIVNHDELREKDTFKEKQGHERNIEEYLKEISSASDIIDDIDFEEVDDWFTDYYNEVISKILCIDEIEISRIIDKKDKLLIVSKGYQYVDTCPVEDIDEISDKLNSVCNRDGIRCWLIADPDMIDEDLDPNSYQITLWLSAPLDIKED